MKISIITATYNSEKTICDTIESVLEQTYTDYEYIIVDGASSDRTMDIVRGYEASFAGRLRYICEPDCGVYDAMNKGIAMATGDIVGLLNSDDFYTKPDVLERMISVFRENETAEAVYGDVHYVSPEKLTKCVRYYSSRLFRPGWMRFGFMPAHPSFYCRRDIYQHFGTFDTSYKVAADFEQLLRLIYINKIRTRYIPMDFVTMRTGGLSNSGMRSHCLIMKDHLRALRTHGIYSNICILSLRYVYKVGEILKTRLFN